MVKLSDVCDVRDGTHDSPQYVVNGYPLVTSKNIIDGKLDLSTVNFIGKDDYNKINERSKVDVGDIIMPMIGTIGNPYLVEGNSDFAIKNVALIKCNTSKVINKFLLYFLQSEAFHRYVGIKNKGGTQKFLALRDIREMEIPELSTNEQLSVVKKIHKLDELIEKRKQQLQKLDELVKARFVEMFGDAKNPKYSKENMGNVAKLQGGYAFKSSDFVDDGIALVQISNVNKDYLDWEDVNKLPVSYKEKYSSFLLEEGDLLLAMTRPIIKSLNAVKVAKVSKNDLPCLLNQRVGRFVCTDKLNPVYLENVCKTVDFKDYIEKMSGNSLQPNVSGRQVEEYKIIMPPIVLQNQFADFVQQIDKSKLEVQKSLEKLETLKKALMQKYFG